jgi:hypothetical protein
VPGYAQDVVDDRREPYRILLGVADATWELAFDRTIG